VNTRATKFDLFAGQGEMRALMRARDWSTSPLGHPDTWPQALRIVVSLMLDSKFPMFVAWGPELGFLYNDAYAEILGAKHSTALGRRFHDVWAEIWMVISPLIERALAGEASYLENLPLRMWRKGHEEQTWFTFSYSPMRDESGAVSGMYCACTETTAQMYAERHQAFQLEMADGLRGLSDPYEVMAKASELLGRHLRASRVVFGEIDHERSLVNFHSNYTDGLVEKLSGVHPLDNFGPGNIAELKQGKTTVFDDVVSDVRANGTASLAHIAAVNARSGMAVPIIRQNTFRAALIVSHSQPRRWTSEEVVLVEEIAERT
jgi:hypothetical protein